MMDSNHFLASMEAALGFQQKAKDKRYSKQELLRRTGITDRQLKYYIKEGAVDPPIGRTRASVYTEAHCLQIVRVLKMLQSPGVTLAAVVQALSEVKGGSGKKKDLIPTSSFGVLTQHVHSVSQGIRIVVDAKLLPSERDLLNRLLKASHVSDQLRRKLAREATTLSLRSI